MNLILYDAKDKKHHRIPYQTVKLVMFTAKSVKIIFKDSRTPDLTVKASQITFDD